MRRPRYTGEAAVYEAVNRLMNKFEYPDELGGGGPFIPSGGGGAPSVVVAASDASDISKSKADYVCTGVSDHDVIQAALDSLDTGSGLGGRVLLTEGTFNCDYGVIFLSALTVQAPVHLQGMGWSTVLNFNDGQFVGIQMNADNGIVSDLWIKGNFVGSRIGIDIDRGQNLVRNVRVSEIGSGTGAAAISLGVQGDRAKIQNCYIDDCSEDGILIQSGATDTIIGNTYVTVSGTAVVAEGPGVVIGDCILLGDSGISVQSQDLQIANTAIYGGSGDGISGNAERVSVSNCIIYDFGGYGIDLNSAFGGGNRVVLSGNNIVSCGAGIRIQNVDSGGLRIHDNWIDTIQEHGIEIATCDKATIHDNQIGAVGLGTANTYDGIHIDGDDNFIHANIIEPLSATRYGINIAGVCNIVVGNNLGATSDYGTDALNDTGADTQLFYPADPIYGDNFIGCYGS